MANETWKFVQEFVQAMKQVSNLSLLLGIRTHVLSLTM